jgi:hypothetical protein
MGKRRYGRKSLVELSRNCPDDERGTVPMAGCCMISARRDWLSGAVAKW